MSLALALTVLLSAAPAPAPAPAAAPQVARVLSDEDAPAAWYQGNSSARLAAPVVIRFDGAVVDTLTLTAASGGASGGTTDAPATALRKHTPAVARRHFEEAKWTTEVGKGRELVLKSVSATFHPGPSYQVQVIVDRVQDGRRLGQATGTGMASADHTADRTRATWAPGPWGRAAAHQANSPHPVEDAPVIQQATIRALDSALLQLAAYWAGEQQAEAMQKQAMEQMKAAQKAAAKGNKK